MARSGLAVLLALETVLAGCMTFLVWDVTSSPFLFPSPVRHVVSVGGAAAGGALTVYCVLLTASVLARDATAQRRLAAKARLVHVLVAFVACLVWLWVFGLVGGLRVVMAWPIGLMAVALAWSQFLLWAVPRVAGEPAREGPGPGQY